MSIHLTFNSLDPHHKYQVCTPLKTGSDSFWLELEIDGVPFRIDFGKQEGSDRTSIHVNGSARLKVDHHSINALDIYIDELVLTGPHSAQRYLVREHGYMRGRCPCEQKMLFFPIVLYDDQVGDRDFPVIARNPNQPALQCVFCEACKCDVEAKALASGMYSLARRPRRENRR